MMSALDTIRNLLILGGLLSASACAQVAGVTGDYHEGTTDHKCVAMVGDPAKTHIDDFESDTGFIDSAPLYGPWFVYADASATCNVPGAPTITLGPGHASGFAGEVTGSNCTIFGGGLGASFNTSRPQTAEICTYDVSAYDGITFYARSDYSTPAFAVVTMSNIQQVKYGGTCPDGPLCSDFYRKLIALTTAWAPYTVKFADLRQAGFGTKVPFDPAQVIGLELQTELATTVATPKFHIAIDDVSFTVAGH